MKLKFKKQLCQTNVGGVTHLKARCQAPQNPFQFFADHPQFRARARN